MESAFWEPVATSCNILSNCVVLYAVCVDPRSPVPIAALGLQVCANAAWVTFATLTHDVYLCTTALASLCLQITSFVLRQRRDGADEGRDRRRPIPGDRSREVLVVRTADAR